MNALADRIFTFLIALAGLAALRQLAARTQDQLAAAHIAMEAERKQVAHERLELLMSARDARHVPWGPEAEGPAVKINVTEDDEITAWQNGDRQAVAEAVQAELLAREQFGIEEGTEDVEQAAQRIEALLADPTRSVAA